MILPRRKIRDGIRGTSNGLDAGGGIDLIIGSSMMIRMIEEHVDSL